MRALFVAITVSGWLLSTGTSGAQIFGPNFGALGAKLEQNMSEDQVVSTVGRQPTSVSLSTCGTETKNGAWQCKIYEYEHGRRGSSLRIYFQRTPAGVWVVSNWNASAGL
jgi:hypothetical protein